MDETNALFHEILSDRGNFADAVGLRVRKLGWELRAENLTVAEPLPPYNDESDGIPEIVVDMRESETRAYLSLVGTVTQTPSDRNVFVVGLRQREAARYLWQSDNGSSELYPVVSILVYFGAEPWTAPRSLREFVRLDESPVREEIERFFNDYKFNFVDFRDVTLDEIQPMRSDFKFYATLYFNLFHPKDAVELPSVKNTELALRFLRRFEDGGNAVKISAERLSQGGYGMDALFTERVVYE